MTTVDLGRIGAAIVAEHLADEGESILDLEVGQSAVRIRTTHGAWTVAPTEAPRDDLMIVAGVTAVVDAAGPVRCFGVLPDGRILPLYEARGLRDYVAAVQPPLDPVDVALLVAEHADPNDRARFVVHTPGRTAAGAPVAAPHTVSDGRAGTRVSVITYTWEHSDDSSTKHHDEWTVSVGADGQLDWTHTALD
ncbi:hypothetical protein MMAG44476_35196 [Mycolicibacterium mageritense DSM 44476 = CIP 104973]|uniref:Uncharacterized protein n=1 Tax=Mycolicibacterium mageritense TaxID=53462 RepID=A0AAI8TVW9_MYCME|nr:hypothetical protein [Mycolicibacterium mageritense]MBN3454500.1 hypothetical protein [Mycobacterium sp. DSM 3803]MCC9184276.1 hypothetical protein [Mycolicibacterium mageritense]TXI65691.1 MAG: hypothetical protein E6Q55_01620 [Mycolicibacterium mageritense]CDO26183.1 hypothetical protein BN978_06737 [Mycolicibacterium mageritense DSM 44476 = CIP 104973]BBX37145.1 hypothetical protein MMAGJ_64270 [Mycolicibacterium mageritense]